MLEKLFYILVISAFYVLVEFYGLVGVIIFFLFAIPLFYYISKNDSKKYYNKKYPVTVDTKWIKNDILFIINQTGYVRPKKYFLFEPDYKFYKRLNNCFKYKNKKEILQKAVNELSDHINISDPPIVNLIDNPKNKNPGIFLYDYYGKHNIKVNFELIHNSYSLAAVLAHELTHYYLFKENLQKEGKENNEKLTDLMSVYLGFGKIMLNGYEPYNLMNISKSDFIADKKNVNTEKVCNNKICAYGYLKVRDISNVFVILCTFYNISFEKAIKNVCMKAQKHIKNSYKEIKKSNYFVKNKSKITKEELMIARCYYCGQKLRFPVKKKDLIIKCPTCNKKIILYADKL